jgi:hypothetical protein
MFSSLRSTAQQDLVVNVTTDYDMFIKHDGNRKVNELNLNKLVKSMKKKTLISPIIVNENLEVIDGQHRLAALEKLKQPVYYVKISGYGLPEMQILNSVSKNWTSDDFMESYIDLGYEDYKRYKEFKVRYGFGHTETAAILQNKKSDPGSNSKIRGGEFKTGDFKIGNYDYAVECAEKIEMVKPFYSGYKRRVFIYAMMRLFDNSNYNHSVFLGKLSYQSASLVDCVSTEQYLLLIEEIYNYKNKNKVSLRY